jgi:hypothetical protein
MLPPGALVQIRNSPGSCREGLISGHAPWTPVASHACRGLPAVRPVSGSRYREPMWIDSDPARVLCRGPDTDGVVHGINTLHDSKGNDHHPVIAEGQEEPPPVIIERTVPGPGHASRYLQG